MTSRSKTKSTDTSAPRSHLPELEEKDVFPVALVTLKPGEVLNFDLYHRQETPGKSRFILYRHQQLPFTAKVSQRLISYGVEKLYVSHSDRKAYEAHCKAFNVAEADDVLAAIRIAKAKKCYEEAAQIASDLFAGRVQNELMPKVYHSMNQLTDFTEAVPEAYNYLLGFRQRQHHLALHSVNVAVLSVGLAKYSGCHNHEILQNVGLGGFLHDVGMIRVPNQILHKTGPLSTKERALIEHHPEFGSNWLLKQRGVHWLARHIVNQHHEKCDGSGYPRGVDADEIHVCARIVTLAEIYDALTTERCYAEALPPKQALELMIHEMRNELDQKLLIRLIEFVGSLRLPESNEEIVLPPENNPSESSAIQSQTDRSSSKIVVSLTDEE